MSQTPQVNLTALWRYVIDQVKAQTSTPALWRSMEAGKPVTLENEELILGYSGAESHQKSLLMDSRNRNMVEQILVAAIRRPMRLRIIEGETVQDWEAVKQSEAAATQLQDASRQQYQRELDAGASWEAVVEGLIRKLGTMPNRALASVQGRFLDEALDTLAESYGRLMTETSTEQDERSYSRALERLSERVGIPSSMIGYLVHIRRKGA